MSGNRLVEAAMIGDTRAVAQLLSGGGDCTAASSDGTLPLYAAAVGGHAEAVALLLGAGADPNAESAGESDGTPLCAAACCDRGSIALVSLLLERGADPTVALEIAESWLGVGVEASLRDELSTDDVEFVVRREPRAEGSERIEVTGVRRDGGGRTAARETGHARIVELLMAAMP